MAGDASLDEKVSLAELYADSRTNLDRASKLCAEALRRDPENAHYKEVKKKVGHVPGTPTGGPPPIIIMRGRAR